LKLKFIIINILMLGLLLFLVVNHVKHLPANSSTLIKTNNTYSNFIATIKPGTTTLYYNDKKPDFAEFFKLHNIMTPHKNIFNFYRQKQTVQPDYYLIKDFHKVRQKQLFDGDTLLIKKFKDYNIYLIKNQH